MPLTRAAKEDLVSSYQAGLAVAPHAFLVDFKGISVPQVTELRDRVRESGGEYVVVKNRLLLRAIEGSAPPLSYYRKAPERCLYCWITGLGRFPSITYLPQ